MCIDVVLIQVTALVSDQPKISDNFPKYNHLVMSNHHLEMVYGNLSLNGFQIHYHISNKKSITVEAHL